MTTKNTGTNESKFQDEVKDTAHRIWLAGLGALAKAVVDCAGIGVCTSDYSQLTFRNVRRPIYPLDLPNR